MEILEEELQGEQPDLEGKVERMAAAQAQLAALGKWLRILSVAGVASLASVSFMTALLAPRELLPWLAVVIIAVKLALVRAFLVSQMTKQTDHVARCALELDLRLRGTR